MSVVSKVSSKNIPLTLLTLYLSTLAKHPLITKACTSATLYFFQEELAQRVSGFRAYEKEQKKSDCEGCEGKSSVSGKGCISPAKLLFKIVDKRVLQMSLYGLLVAGPLNHYMYDILIRVFSKFPKTKLTTFFQLLAQNLILSPILNSIFIAAMAVINGTRSPGEVLKLIRTRLLGMMKVSWIVFPSVQLFANKFLPPLVWVPFFNLVAFVFGTYMNTKNKIRLVNQLKKQQQQGGGDKDGEKRD
ncbi:hypothetical protein H4219_005786 [Mycoemilia scoparia]|uniref:Uncharacterized protein n=1 Tax=Mycoemilia scoparia TaxID=417184 RepID=A0A9W8DKE6_9FUNG|nr:hypothetical protein H4219_005786 [Mycoemilia scoparia]